MYASAIEIGTVYAIWDQPTGWSNDEEEYRVENALLARVLAKSKGKETNPITKKGTVTANLILVQPVTGDGTDIGDSRTVKARHFLMSAVKRNETLAIWRDHDVMVTTTRIENGQSWSNVMPRLVAAGLTDQDDSERLTNVLAGLDLKGNERVNTDVTPDQIHKTTGHYVDNEGWSEETRTFTLTRDQATLLADALLLVAKHGGAK
jgi:hypothetical protein